ncbi:MAG: SH3 domain-containing protein [Pseudomonadota bacterium]
MLRTWLKAVAVCTLVAGFSQTSTAQIAQIIPVDEAESIPDLQAFRDKMLQAVVERDVDTIVNMASDDIMLDFGGGSGQDTLRQRLSETALFFYSEEEDPADTTRYREEFWLGLESALRLGGVYDAEQQEFTAPHYFRADIGDVPYDPFSTYFVVTNNVAVRDRPNRYGRIIDRLDYELVARLEGGEGTSYIRVQLDGDRSGWVHADLLRSVVDYRAVFSKDSGTWKMTVLIAGD